MNSYFKPEKTYKLINKELPEEIKVEIYGIKVYINCLRCGRRWTLFFKDMQDLENRLASDWYLCGNCFRELNKQSNQESEKELHYGNYTTK